MKGAVLVTLLLSQHGYWPGGGDAHLLVARNAQMPSVSAQVEWKLLLDKTLVASGTSAIELTDQPADVLVRTPAVRERADFTFAYAVRSKANDTPIQSGELPVHLFPTGLVRDHAKAAEEKRIVVLDNEPRLVDFLRIAKLKPTRVQKSSRLELLAPDLLFIGPKQWSGETEEAVIGLVRGGCSALVLRQPAGDSVEGWPLAPRSAPADFDWKLTHPMFRGLDADDLRSLLADARTDPVCIRMAPDAAALPLAAWPRELPEVKASPATPIDCLIVTQTLGRGRLLLCQLPLPDWAEDPRAQILLNNALDYLLTRPEPTPRPSDRLTPAPAVPQAPKNRIPIEEKE